MPQADQLKAAPAPTRRFKGATLALLVTALIVHVLVATHNFSLGNLAGHEFRQTQTALSILFIQKEGDFSLAYPTPLFGPPWSIPMEFPLYQWTVAGVINATGWSLPIASRLVSLICFYLTLPAIYLLLRRWKISPDTSRICITLVTLTPVYIFYSRAVLIESMALLASVWFLWAFDRMCRAPTIAGGLLVGAIGATGALVKVTTFIPWCLIAAAIGLNWSWREWKRGGFRPWLKTVGWGSLAAAIPGLSIIAWLRFSDRIKAQSPGGAELASSALSDVNFGGWQDRIGMESLSSLAREMGKGTLPWWIVLIVALVGAFLFRRDKYRPAQLIAGLGATLMLFPVLYHRHDYYFYAVGILPVCALGLTLGKRVNHHMGRWVAIIALIGFVSLQVSAYRKNYWPLQDLVSYGGTGLTNFIKDMLPDDAALVVMGQDWAAVIPYYSQRKGIMIRQNVVDSADKLQQHLTNLAHTRVSALIDTSPAESDRSAAKFITQALGLESEPSITHQETEVYLAKDIRSPTLIRLGENMHYSGVEIRGIPDRPPPAPEPEPIVADSEIQTVTGLQALITFAPVSPAPYQYRCKFGLGASHHDGQTVLGAHPDSDLWIRRPAATGKVVYGIGMDSGTFDAVGESDGVEFVIKGVDASGKEIELARHLLDPAHNAADRTVTNFEIDLPDDISELVFSTRARQSYNFDWAYWRTIEIR